MAPGFCMVSLWVSICVYFEVSVVVWAVDFAVWVVEAAGQSWAVIGIGRHVVVCVGQRSLSG